MNRFLSYCAVFLGIMCSGVHAQDAPVLRCISLDGNDDITLYWEQPSDTGADFNHILISYAQGTSLNFQPVAQVTDYNQTSVLVNGNYNQQGRFIIQQVYNGFSDTSDVRDTVSPIIIGLSSSGKVVSLGWNPTGLASTDSVFTVFKRNPSGNFEVLRKLDFPQTATLDTIGSCTEEVAYRVEVKGIGGCISRSNTVEATILDELPPEKTDLIFASVDTATGLVNVEWKRSRSRDAFGYIVYYFEDFVRSDTVFGRNTTTYTYDEFGINGLIRPETLSVAPFDSCLGAQSGWYNQAADGLRFQTMYFDTAGYDRCAGELTLAWSFPRDTEIVLGVQNLSGFHIYKKIHGEGSELIANVSAQDSIFIDRSVEMGKKYTYVVAPYDDINQKQALSNKVVINLAEKDEPEYVYIKSIVNDHESGRNQVRLYADAESETVSYGLLRSLSDTEEGLIEVEKFTEDLAEEMELEDPSGEAEQSAFYYQVVAYDICDVEIGRSQTARSIHIGGEKIIRDLINETDWNAYEGYDTAGRSDVLYDLYRLTNDVETDLIYSTYEVYEYRDDIVDQRWISGDICYYVEAEQDEDNIFGFDERSKSNKVCFQYPPKVFIPDAFSPDDDGLNDVFLPNVNYIDPNTYRLMVYDRMGNLIFQTTNAEQGWDGSDQPNGVYAYALELSNARGEVLEYAGKIHLIR